MKKILLILTSFLLLCSLFSCGGGSGSSTSTPDSEETGNTDNVDSSGDGSGNQNSGSGENTGSTDSSDTGSGSDNSDSGEGNGNTDNQNSGSGEGTDDSGDESGDTGNSSDGSGNSGSTVTIPGAPANLATVTVAASTITLSWNAVSGATSYKLYRSDSENGSYSAVTEGISDTTVTDTGLTPLASYYYKVSAVNSAGESELSSAVSGTTVQGLTVNIEFDPALVSTIGKMEVNVSDSNITTTIPGSAGTSSYSVEVIKTSGSSLTFSVLAKTADSDTSAALQFYGETTADISSATNSVTVDMKLHKTRIVIPDNVNARIVQIDDMTGTNWTEVNLKDQYDDLDELDSDTFYRFNPCEIDFDNAGRIYITNDYYDTFTGWAATGSNTGIFRLDTMDAAAEIVAGHDTDDSLVEDISRIAIDRESNTLYFMVMGDEDDDADSLLYTASLSDPDSATPISLSSFVDGTDYSLYSVCPGKEGTIYLYGEFTVASTAAQIIHLDIADPDSPQLLHSTYIGDNPSYIFDITMYKDSLYATFYGTSSYVSYLAAMDLDLTNLVTNSFAYTDSDGNSKSIFVPMSFVGVRPEDLIFTNIGGKYSRQLASVTDITATEFTSFGEDKDDYPDSTDPFMFYYSC